MGCLTGLESKNPTRDADIVKRYHAGEAFTEIGRAYGIQPKRVRTIIDRRGGLNASACSANLKTACAAKDREMNYRNKRRFDIEAEVPGIGMVRHVVVAMDLDHLTLKVRRSYPGPGVQLRSVIELGRV